MVHWGLAFWAGVRVDSTVREALVLCRELSTTNLSLAFLMDYSQYVTMNYVWGEHVLVGR